MEYTIFWFRRDLRLHDNIGLIEALSNNENILPIFIFDDKITTELPKDDARITFIYRNLKEINTALEKYNSSLLCLQGNPLEVWKELLETYKIKNVYTNKDYEPYAIKRDLKVKELLIGKGIEFLSFKDQVIHEENDVLKGDGTPYTVYTPYKNKWREVYKTQRPRPLSSTKNFHSEKFNFPTMEKLGFETSTIEVKPYDLSQIEKYSEKRNFPIMDATSYLSPHLRFGTISVRSIIDQLDPQNESFLNELIWREFFMQILFHFPHVVTGNFRSKYDKIEWRNNEEDYKKWCEGKTGYAMVDAGMRQLNKTGYMHNRVRMITAGFLCKHLLIDWRLGEAYFAKKLLDYELASNNGNWQWAAGTGCDAAPYFRVFNPLEQQKKFDKNYQYIKKWVPEFDTLNYPIPMVEHTFARKRALDTYKVGIESE